MVVPLIQQQNSSINCVSKNYKNNSTDNDEKSIFMINNNLKCSVCDIECDSQYSLDNHRLQTHCKIGKSNRCGICHNILDSKDIFVEHSLEHNDDVSQISCCVCRQTVKSQWQLSMHAEFHLDIFSNLLSKIQESNLTEETINNEKKQTNNADSNNENNSSTSPATSTDSKDEEMKKIIEINEFTCNTCFKQFTSLNALQGHSHIHRHPRNHRCDLCKMAFSTKARLEIHKKKHYCNKDVKCQICDEKFNKSDLLKKHMKTHESNLKNIS
uniref:C2H2-type domain-containing protein n=1 Tax=Parastrongyloides trichosuri TaxID=131310 RepID=A0A0N5A5G8_PARTI